MTRIYYAVLEKYGIRTTEVVDMGMVNRNKKPKIKGELSVVTPLETKSASRNQGRREAHFVHFLF